MDGVLFKYLRFAHVVLVNMVPSPDAIAIARKVTHLSIEIDETPLRIPITYIRTKIRSCRPLFTQDSSTHEIRFKDEKGVILVAPIHDIVFLSQCFSLQHLFIPRSDGQTMWLTNTPDVRAIQVILRWLYSNDVGELRADLEVLSDDLLLEFSRVYRMFGILDPRVRENLRKVMEERFFWLLRHKMQ
jgi:hypothetical protein